MKRYMVDLAVGMKRDTVVTFEKESEEEAIKYAVGIMRLRHNLLGASGYFVYSIEEV